MARTPETQTERGATAVEYALLASLIAAAIAVVVALLGIATAGTYSGFNSNLEECISDGC